MSKKATAPQAEILDFQAALLSACPREERENLLREARLLTYAFAPTGRKSELLAMAEALLLSDRDQDFPRARARKLAAALHVLIRG